MWTQIENLIESHTFYIFRNTYETYVYNDSCDVPEGSKKKKLRLSIQLDGVDKENKFVSTRSFR